MVCGRHGTYWPESPGRPAQAVRLVFCTARTGSCSRRASTASFDRGSSASRATATSSSHPSHTGRHWSGWGSQCAIRLNVGAFTAVQRHFLDYHRDMVLLKSAGRQRSILNVHYSRTLFLAIGRGVEIHSKVKSTLRHPVHYRNAYCATLLHSSPCPA
jgi:hypothetical protein